MNPLAWVCGKAETEAGREMDAEVEHLVFGNACRAVGPAPDGEVWFDPDGFAVPRHYSTKIEDAWRVVEKLRAGGWVMTLSVNDFITEPWDCRFFLGERRREIAHGATAPIAICRAALKAVGSV